MTKPIRLWLTPSGPNPWKVVVILKELQVPYEIKSFKFDDVKKKPFIDINPNERVPAIEDPNHDLTLWESGAIITYLIEQYNPTRLLTYGTLKEKHHLNQWLHFQMSGQGPYCHTELQYIIRPRICNSPTDRDSLVSKITSPCYTYWGTAGWFNVLHHEKLPSAIERYNAQVLRVLGVLDKWLDGKEWLVGDKITYADLAWATWNDRLDSVILCPADNKFEGFPNVKAWHERMTSRPSWKKAMEIRAKLMDEQGLTWEGRPKGIASHTEYETMIAAGEDTSARE